MNVLSPLKSERCVAIATGHSSSDAADWMRYVERHPHASLYHDWRWREVFTNAFGHECAYFIARDGNHTVGVLPTVVMTSRLFGRFVISLPFVNYGGVLADDTVAAVALEEAAADLARRRGAEYVEFRHRARLFPDLSVKAHKVGMELSLASTTEAAWARLDRKVRNQIRKAEKSGLTLRLGGPELLADFYDVFAENMRDLGTPVYGLRFFTEVAQRFAEAVHVLVVDQGRETVAGGIALSHGDRMEIPWAGSRAAARPLCPNHLLYWSAISRAIADERRIFDFGRSTPDEGTFHYKRQWGAEPVPLYWEYRLLRRATVPDLTPKNPRFQAAIRLWKHLPVRATRMLGPSIVRSIP